MPEKQHVTQSNVDVFATVDNDVLEDINPTELDIKKYDVEVKNKVDI